jgi:ribosomal protein L14
MFRLNTEYQIKVITKNDIQHVVVVAFHKENTTNGNNQIEYESTAGVIVDQKRPA